MERTVEEIRHGPQLLAVIVPAEYGQEGIRFFTPPVFSQQLAYMRRPAGYVIEPHVHNLVRREVVNTLEVLFIRQGRAELTIYDEERQPVASRVLRAGDVVLLAAGGHGLRMMETTEIIEVKQGPYAGDQDKTRFVPISPCNEGAKKSPREH